MLVTYHSYHHSMSQRQSHRLALDARSTAQVIPENWNLKLSMPTALFHLQLEIAVQNTDGKIIFNFTKQGLIL